jgi:Tol biopolymer transport system component
MQLTQSSSYSSVTPEISDDGSLIAIASSADLVVGGNPTFDSQIFVLRSDGSGTVQITDGDADSRAPDISANGGFVAFQSLADLTGEKPAAFPGDPTIFWARTDGTELTQVLTDDRLDDPAAFANTRLATDPEISGDGSRIVFVSPLNYTDATISTRLKIYMIER